MTQELCVVADIGGTNTRVGVSRAGTVDEGSIARFRNAEHRGIGPILSRYLADRALSPVGVCVDMAGPVKHGVGTLTNLDWTVDSAALSAATGARHVAVINDLQAQGFAVPSLGHDSLTQVLAGRDPDGEAPRLVLNVGTGLNAAPVYVVHGQTHVPPAEAGHVSLLARDAEELALVQWITEAHGRPGLEDILSGRGLERLFAFVCHDERRGTPCAAAEIMEAFLQGNAQAARAARLFTRFLGRYAGDLALITLPFSGLYLVGGVVRHLGPHLLHLGFAQAFADKGRFGSYMTQFPVHLVTDDYAALKGCASYLAQEMERAAIGALS